MVGPQVDTGQQPLQERALRSNTAGREEANGRSQGMHGDLPTSSKILHAWDSSQLFFLHLSNVSEKEKESGIAALWALSSLPLGESTGPFTEENYRTIKSHTEKLGALSEHFSSVCMRGKRDDFNVPDRDDRINPFSTVTH